MQRLPILALASAALVLLSGPLTAQAFRVVSVTPAPNDRAAPTMGDIRVTFSTTVAAASVGPGSVSVYGRWSGVVPGTISFTPDGRTAIFSPSRPCFPGEHVGVALARTVRSTSGQSLPAGYAWRFTVATGAGSGTFQRGRTIRLRRAGETFLQVYGAYAGDLDRDGSPDLSLPCEATSDIRVFTNDGCGVFGGLVVHAQTGRTRPSTNEGHDLNRDGWIDFAVGNTADGSVSVFLNDGAGGYLPEVRYAVGRVPRGIAPLDVDGDGDVDLVAANRNSSDLALLRNNGNGTFQPATFFEGGGDGETSVAGADADGDGITDLFVANHVSQTLTLLLGNGNGGFTVSATQPVGGTPWMLDLGDVDGDGNIDAVTVDASSATASIVRSDGIGGLLPATSIAVGGFPTAVDVGDLDADGDVDVVVSSFSAARFDLLINDGTGVFTLSTSLPSVQAASCSLLVDFDRDGDIDILGIDELEDVVVVFEQVNAVHAGLQPRSCDAALRVDNLGLGAGFRGRPAHRVRRGGDLALGISSQPVRAFGLLAGLADQVGSPTSFGTLNLLLPAIPVLAASTDRHGEWLIVLPVPSSTAVGVQLAFQSAVLVGGDIGLILSNAEIIETR